MALVTEFTCAVCRQPCHELVVRDHRGPVCAGCRQADLAKESKVRRLTLASYEGLTERERLAQLEASLYDLKRQVSDLVAA